MYKVNSEASLTFALSRWLRHSYPDILFHFDYGSGIKMTMGQAVLQKRLNPRAWPDLFVAAQRHGKAGLFIELKKNGNNPYLKNGQVRNNQHFQEQAANLKRLQAAGYEAVFAVGYDAAVAVIAGYLGEHPNDHATMF